MTYRPETVTVHAGQEEADPATNARAVPIYQTTSYVFNDTEHAANLFALAEPGNIYTRIMNPTQRVFEERVAELEGGVGALATASGSAATTYAIQNIAYAGDNIVAITSLYGGTYDLFAPHPPRSSASRSSFVDPNDPEDFRSAIDDKTKLVFAETIGNPKLERRRHPGLGRCRPRAGLPLIVDNTDRRPRILCRPIDHGADIVVHAATKYIGGHGTSIGGVIVDSGKFDWAAHADRFPGLTKPDARYHGRRLDRGPRARSPTSSGARTVLLRNIGAAISPFNSFLFLQGLETLHLRMERHSANALASRSTCRSTRRSTWVSYPGLECHPTTRRWPSIPLPAGYGGHRRLRHRRRPRRRASASSRH